MIDRDSKALERMEDETDRTIREIGESVELTMIFNRHVNSKNAEEYVDHIEPDSVVFIEGYGSESGHGALYKNSLDHLAVLRTLRGKQDPDYTSLKQHILDSIETHNTIPRESYTDFSEFSMRQIQLLLEKDCVILYADVQPAHENDAQGMEINEHFYNHKAKADINPVDNITPSANTAKTIHAMYKNVESQYEQYRLRESYAFASFITYFAAVHEYPDSRDNLNLTEHGKIKTYMTYGAAHTDSLADVFESNDIPLRSIAIKAPPQDARIDKSWPEFRRNLPRRVAFSAIKSLSYSLDEFSSLSEFNKKQSAIYENLAPLNNDQDATIKFLIQCIQIKQETFKDGSRARNWFDSTINQDLDIGI